MRLDTDRLREIGNVGAGHAATALSSLLGELHWMDPPRGRCLTDSELPADLVPAGDRIAAVFVDLVGEVEGVAGLLIPRSVVPELLRPLFGVAPGRALDSRSRSALGELGNIVLCAATGAIAALSGVVVIPSVPRLVFEGVGPGLAGALPQGLRLGPSYLVDSALSRRDGSCELRFLWLSSLWKARFPYSSVP